MAEQLTTPAVAPEATRPAPREYLAKLAGNWTCIYRDAVGETQTLTGPTVQLSPNCIQLKSTLNGVPADSLLTYDVANQMFVQLIVSAKGEYEVTAASGPIDSETLVFHTMYPPYMAQNTRTLTFADNYATQYITHKYVHDGRTVIRTAICTKQ